MSWSAWNIWLPRTRQVITHRAKWGVFLFLLLILVLAAASWAQSGDQGSIEGTVTDPSGALVPGVTLTVRNAATAAAFTTRSNENGLFRFPVLPAGMYELVAQRSGFATLIQKNVVVTVGGSINLSVSLRVAEKAESIIVSNDSPIVETTRT